jgi:quinolinate synthase
MDELNRIMQLRKEKNAIILATNLCATSGYVNFMGDSFRLSQKAVTSGLKLLFLRCGAS